MAYQPIQMPQPRGLGGFADFLMDIAKQNREDNARRADLILRRDQMAQQAKSAASDDAYRQGLLGIQQQQEKDRQSARQAEATQQITAALDSGRFDLAQQIAKAHGIDVKQFTEGARPAQELPPKEVPNPAPEFGPQATTEIARNAGRIRAEQASFEPNAGPDSQYMGDAETERNRFASAQAPQLIPQSTPADPGRTKYMLAGLEYDPDETRRAQAEQRGRNTERFASAMGDVEGMAKYIPIYQGGVAAGLSPEKSFELMQKRMEIDEAAAQRNETARLNREQSDVNNRRMAAAIGARPAADRPFKQANEDRQEEQTIDAMAKTVFGQTGFKEVQVGNRKFNDMAAALSKPNAALDAVSAGSFVKMAQGGTGVISDSDMDAFWNRIGGVKERSEQWVQNVLSGKIAPEKRQIVGSALKELAARAQSNLGQIKEALRYRIDNSVFKGRTDDLLGTYFPEERNRIEESRRIEAAKNRRRANQIKGGGRDALDDELDGL